MGVTPNQIRSYCANHQKCNERTATSRLEMGDRTSHCRSSASDRGYTKRSVHRATVRRFSFERGREDLPATSISSFGGRGRAALSDDLAQHSGNAALQTGVVALLEE